MKKQTKKAAPKKAAKKTAPKKGKKAAKKKAQRAKAQVKKVVTTTVTTTTTTTATTSINPKETYYLLVLDESTSMGPVRNETRIGMNEQIKTIKELNKKYPNHDYFVSIVKFSTGVSTLIENVPAEKVKELSEQDYMPNGWTALHDAIGMGITNLKNKIESKLNSGEASALVVILTDGEENQSKEFDASKIKSLISGLEKTGMWTFVFIGANQDSVLTAQNLGVSRGNTINYTATAGGTSLAFMTANSAISKRAAYSDAGVYGATTDCFMASATRGASNIGEDANLLDLSGTITEEDIKKAKKDLDNKKSNI